jgi:hypothetical protein
MINVIKTNPAIVIVNSEITIINPWPSSKSFLPNFNTIDRIITESKKINKIVV